MKQVVAALILRGSELLICQRTKHQPMPLKWEFPGGKVEPAEEPQAALARELEEELGIHATIGPEVASQCPTILPSLFEEQEHIPNAKTAAKSETNIRREHPSIGNLLHP